MKNLFHQTKQAFYFSLAFYLFGVILFFLNITFAPIIISVSMLVSMIWVFLVLREIMLSKRIGSVERLFLILFIIFFNIIAGIAYFFFLRDGLTGKQNN